MGMLRRIISLAMREGRCPRNPAARIGELMRRVDRRLSTETRDVDYWTRPEADALIALAREHEPRFAPALVFAFSTGCRCPLRFDATRHSWATWALRAGESVRWLAQQLGHQDPAFTLRVYAQAMREEETELSFAEALGSTATGDAQASPDVSNTSPAS
jgi:integrase